MSAHFLPRSDLALPRCVLLPLLLLRISPAYFLLSLSCRLSRLSRTLLRPNPPDLLGKVEELVKGQSAVVVAVHHVEGFGAMRRVSHCPEPGRDLRRGRRTGTRSTAGNRHFGSKEGGEERRHHTPLFFSENPALDRSTIRMHGGLHSSPPGYCNSTTSPSLAAPPPPLRLSLTHSP